MSSIPDKFVPLHPKVETIDLIREKLDSKEADEYLKKCIHGIIMLGMGNNVFLKRTLTSGAFPQHYGYRLMNALIEVANSKMNNLFGMRLYDMDTKFLLVNTEPEVKEMIDCPTEDHKSVAILELILIDLFGSTENRLTLEEILNSLEPYDIDRKTFDELLDSYMKKLYISKEKKNDKIYYSWGPRARAEIDPDSFFERFLELNDSSSPEDWPDLKKRVESLKEITNR